MTLRKHIFPKLDIVRIIWQQFYFPVSGGIIILGVVGEYFNRFLSGDIIRNRWGKEIKEEMRKQE